MMDRTTELQNALQKLANQYLWIKLLKKSVDVLFNNHKNIELMESMAKDFFHQLNIIMIHQLILSYCKITDPYNKLGTNLTIDYFIETKNCVICKNEKISNAKKEINKFREYILSSRNKIIAHNDFKTMVTSTEIGGFPEGEDEKYLKNIEDIINE